MQAQAAHDAPFDLGDEAVGAGPLLRQALPARFDRLVGELKGARDDAGAREEGGERLGVARLARADVDRAHRPPLLLRSAYHSRDSRASLSAGPSHTSGKIIEK